MSQQRIIVNGYSAKVLDDTGVCLYARKNGKETCEINSPARKQRKQFFMNAALDGADEVLQLRRRYVVYNLISVMSQESRKVIEKVVYRRASGNDWYVESKKKTIEA